MYYHWSFRTLGALGKINFSLDSSDASSKWLKYTESRWWVYQYRCLWTLLSSRYTHLIVLSVSDFVLLLIGLAILLVYIYKCCQKGNTNYVFSTICFLSITVYRQPSSVISADQYEYKLKHLILYVTASFNERCSYDASCKTYAFCST